MDDQETEPAFGPGEESQAEGTSLEPRFRGSRADKKAFAKRLGNLIHGRGIRQAELARRSELAPHLISSYMLGKAVPGKVNLIKIARALNVSADELLPEPTEDDAFASTAPISLVVSRTDPTMATLRVNMQVRTDVGSEIIKMLMAGQGR